MQDNYPDIDKKITDKGWAAMRDLLDEEMPVAAPPEKKRRRWMLFLLFFGIGLGIAISVVAGSLYFMEKDVEETRNAVIQQPIAEENAATNLESKTSSEMAAADAVLEENQKLNTADISNNAPLNQEKSSTKAANLKNEGQNKVADAVLKNSKNGKEFINQSTTNSTKVVNKKVNQPAVLISENTLSETSNLNDINFESFNENDGQVILKSKVSDVNYLEINDLNELDNIASIPDFEMNLPALELENEDDDKKTPKSKARFGVEIAGQSAPNFVGASAGLVYSVPLKNKWSLQTGANYQYQRRTFEGNRIPVETANQIEASYPGLGEDVLEGVYSVNSVRSDSAIFTIPQNLSSQYLNIPLRVNYQLNDKWSIGTGLMGSLLLYARNDYTDGGILNNNSDRFTSFDDLAVAGGSQGADEFSKSIDRANLRNFDVAATAGIAFHPSPKWSIAANYHHGLTTLFKYSSDKKYNRYANLSLQYHFGK